MKPPRFLRPRLLLLPLLFGVLVAPAFFTTSAMDTNRDMHADMACKDGVAPMRKLDPMRKPDPPRTPPNCVNCRAPLINAPLARTDRTAAPVVETPPAA